jgi:phospholipid/cholesterol/gamma-HCH transport system ATP-binding protein
VDNTTALVVTYRYQDGNLVANFRYNSGSGRLDQAGDAGTNTVFMVLREGRLIFEGNQAKLESSSDPYITKFIKRPEQNAA